MVTQTDEGERKLKPARENPWYVLATIAGEQDRAVVDWELHEPNRRYWNGWMAARMSEEERAEILKLEGWMAADLAPLRSEEIAEIKAKFDGRGIALPDEAAEIDYSSTKFDKLFVAERFAFSGNADFRSAAFSGEADFESAAFSGNADFESAAFSGEADFKSAAFSGYADFESAEFSGEADFRSAAFSGNANFMSAVFSGEADFRSAAFSGNANFMSAVFSDYAYFGSAAFSGNALFSRAAFSGEADFESAAFSGYTDFESAAFSDYAYFGSAAFSGYADFSGEEFGGASTFAAAAFEKKVDFSDRVFANATDFRAARFVGEPPKFFEAKLHENTDWEDIVWPDDPPDRSAAMRYRQAYERLKVLMDGQNKFHAEHMFLRKELRCREIEEGWSVAGIGSRFYRVVSDYGWSVTRPLALLVMFWALGWAALARLECGDAACRGDMAELSFANLFGFLGMHRHVSKDEIELVEGWSEWVVVGQTFAGLFMVFFLALALRNRFRIK